jgi:hypothetical protein
LDALNNVKRRKWFSSGVTSMSELMPKFDGAAERSEWLTAYTKSLTDISGTVSLDKLIKPSVKADILAGWYRDIRIQYCAGPASVDRVRSNADQDRFEYLRTIARMKKAEQLQMELA